MATVHTCHDCAVAVANGDFSHIGDEETESLITGNMELYGSMSHVGPGNIPGYFTCDLCWNPSMGGEEFESEKDPD